MVNPYFFDSTVYWSEGDERAHFEWLERIPAIKRVRGEGTKVFLEISDTTLTSNDLRELESVYRRYGGDLKQLANLNSTDQQ